MIAPVLGEGLRCSCEVTPHVLCREAGDECYMQSIWHEILTYFMPDLPRAWYRKCHLTAQNIFVNIIFVMIM